MNDLINDSLKQIDRMNQQLHNKKIEDLQVNSNISIMNVALATQQLAMEQQNANALQQSTIEVLKEHQKEFKKRNDILEDEIRSTNKHNKIMLSITIISTCVAIASLITTIIIAILK